MTERPDAPAAQRPEQFLMRLVGGPHASQRVVPADVMPWPLPDRLPDPEGRGFYVKQSESQLPPQAPDSHVLRGAEYFWESADDGAVLCGAIGCSNPATHTWSGNPTCDDCETPMRRAARG